MSNPAGQDATCRVTVTALALLLVEQGSLRHV